MPGRPHQSSLAKFLVTCVHVDSPAEQRGHSGLVVVSRGFDHRFSAGEDTRYANPHGEDSRHNIKAPDHARYTSRRFSIPVLSPNFSVGTPTLSSMVR